MNAEDLAKILDELGQRLGPTGEHVFGLAIRQVFIEAGIGTTIGLALLIIGIAIPFIGRRYYIGSLARYEDRSKHPYDYTSPPDRDMIATVWGSASALTSGLAIFILAWSLPALLNPEYAALRDILGAIR